MREETRLQRQIRDYLELKGFRTVHVPNGAIFAGTQIQRAIQWNSLKRSGVCPGFPDLIVYGPDRFIGHIEVKCEGEYASDDQMEVEHWLSDYGHLYAICRSLMDVDETLERWGWRQTGPNRMELA